MNAWLRALPVYHERGAKPVACEHAGSEESQADASLYVLLADVTLPAGTWLSVPEES